MYRGKSVAVVVPAYNEEEFVGGVLDSIPDFVDRVYAVDDCSTDGTWEEIKKRAGRPTDEPMTSRTNGGSGSKPNTSPSGTRSDGGVASSVGDPSPESGADDRRTSPRITPIRHPTNRGVGAAIKTGYRRALQDQMSVTAVINGDGQMDPAILDRFVEPIVKGIADYTKGNRLRSRDLYADMSTWRLTGNVILTFLTKVASGYWKTNDPQNGYTAVSLEVLEAVDLDELYDRYGFLNDLLVTLNVHGFRVADVPMEAIYSDEESDISYSSFIPRVSSLLLRGFLWRLRSKYFVVDFHPLVFFYAFGSIGTLVGVCYGLWVVSSSRSVLALGFALLLLLLSSTLLAFAMVFDMRHNEDLEAVTAR